MLAESEVIEIINDLPEYVKKQENIENKGKYPDYHQVKPFGIIKLGIEFFKGRQDR